MRKQWQYAKYALLIPSPPAALPLLSNRCSNRALALLKLNKFAKALTDAEQCTRLDPSNVKGWYRQVCVHPAA
jgi:hypothetical protein